LARYRDGEPAARIATSLGRSTPLVYKWLRAAGVELRKPRWELDETSLDEVDGETAHYVLGLLFADGSVYDEAACDSSRITIGLQARDGDILYRVRDFFKSTHPIEYREPQENEGAAVPWRGPQNVLRFSSSRIAAKMRELGYGRVKPQHRPAERLVNSRHWLRGLLDGDGSIFMSRTTDKPKITLTSSPALTNAFVAFVESVSHAKAKPKFRRGAMRYYIGDAVVLIVLKELYWGSTIHINRKFNRAMAILQKWADHPVLADIRDELKAMPPVEYV
jgi:hypothetical protein